MFDRPTLMRCTNTGNVFKPEQIANECLASAEAGAAAVHIHVRAGYNAGASRKTCFG